MSLVDLEQTLKSWRSNFYEAGKALLKIRDEALYQEALFESFPEYVRVRWDISRSQAYRLINAARVLDNLSPIGDGILPQTESQARILSQLSSHDQRRIWQEFISSGEPLTAANLRRWIEPKREKAIHPNTVDRVSAAFKNAVLSMMEQIRVARNDHWRETSKQRGLYWVWVMKDLIHGKR